MIFRLIGSPINKPDDDSLIVVIINAVTADNCFCIQALLTYLEGALQMKEQSLQITIEDWTTEGEVVHQIQREIRSLKDRLNLRKTALYE